MRMIPTHRNAGHKHGRFSLTSLISECRTKADERSWRRAAYLESVELAMGLALRSGVCTCNCFHWLSSNSTAFGNNAERT